MERCVGLCQFNERSADFAEVLDKSSVVTRKAKKRTYVFDFLWYRKVVDSCTFVILWLDSVFTDIVSKKLDTLLPKK